MSLYKKWVISYGIETQKDLVKLNEVEEQLQALTHVYITLPSTDPKSGVIFEELILFIESIKAEQEESLLVIYRVFNPVIFKYFYVANALVRNNAIILYKSLFPIIDPDLNHMLIKKEFQNQLSMILSFLKDPSPIIRLTTIDLYYHILKTQFTFISKASLFDLHNIIYKELLPTFNKKEITSFLEWKLSTIEELKEDYLGEVMGFKEDLLDVENENLQPILKFFLNLEELELKLEFKIELEYFIKSFYDFQSGLLPKAYYDLLQKYYFDLTKSPNDLICTYYQLYKTDKPFTLSFYFNLLSSQGSSSCKRRIIRKIIRVIEELLEFGKLKDEGKVLMNVELVVVFLNSLKSFRENPILKPLLKMLDSLKLEGILTNFNTSSSIQSTLLTFVIQLESFIPLKKETYYTESYERLISANDLVGLEGILEFICHDETTLKRYFDWLELGLRNEVEVSKIEHFKAILKNEELSIRLFSSGTYSELKEVIKGYEKAAFEGREGTQGAKLELIKLGLKFEFLDLIQDKPMALFSALIESFQRWNNLSKVLGSRKEMIHLILSLINQLITANPLVIIKNQSLSLLLDTLIINVEIESDNFVLLLELLNTLIGCFNLKMVEEVSVALATLLDCYFQAELNSKLKPKINQQAQLIFKTLKEHTNYKEFNMEFNISLLSLVFGIGDLKCPLNKEKDTVLKILLRYLDNWYKSNEIEVEEILRSIILGWCESKIFQNIISTLSKSGKNSLLLTKIDELLVELKEVDFIDLGKTEWADGLEQDGVLCACECGRFTKWDGKIYWLE